MALLSQVVAASRRVFASHLKGTRTMLPCRVRKPAMGILGQGCGLPSGGGNRAVACLARVRWNAGSVCRAAQCLHGADCLTDTLCGSCPDAAKRDPQRGHPFVLTLLCIHVSQMSDDDCECDCGCLVLWALLLNVVGWTLYYVIATGLWFIDAGPEPLGGITAGLIVCGILWVCGGAAAKTGAASSSSSALTSPLTSPLTVVVEDPPLVVNETITVSRAVVGPGGMFSEQATVSDTYVG